jgi:hypothetical protein
MDQITKSMITKGIFDILLNGLLSVGGVKCMKRRQRLRLAFTIHNGDALFVVVVGLSGLARRLAESRLSALGSTAGHWA